MPSRPARKNSRKPRSLDEGLGPTFNLDSCGGCHSQPAIGGTSPRLNPQVAFANSANKVPSFITANGPVREARFVRNPDGSPDGGVHGLFTMSGRPGAESCVLRQPDFAAEAARNNVVFRIPTPVFGAGLIEAIPDTEILQEPGQRGVSQAAARHSRPTQRAVVRQFDHRPAQLQRQRRHHRALRAQGAEQVAADLLGRGLQRRDGDHEPAGSRPSATRPRAAGISPPRPTAKPLSNPSQGRLPRPTRRWTGSVRSRSSRSSCASWRRRSSRSK